MKQFLSSQFPADRPNLDCLYKQHNVTLPVAIGLLFPIILTTASTTCQALVFDQPFSGRVQVTDVTGKGVFEENTLSNIEQYQISVRKWAAGVYVLSTESVLGERKMLRFLVGQ